MQRFTPLNHAAAMRKLAGQSDPDLKRYLRQTHTHTHTHTQIPCLYILYRYSGVSLIHCLTHRETVLGSLSRDKVCRPLANVVLASLETTARQQYIAVNGSKYKTAIKKPQIMLRMAPNFSSIRNRVPAHILRHQTFDIVAEFVREASLLWGNPVFKDWKGVQCLHGVVINH